jgi:hypothetical protein
MGTDRLLTQSHTVRQQEKKVIKALFFESFEETVSEGKHGFTTFGRGIFHRYIYRYVQRYIVDESSMFVKSIAPPQVIFCRFEQV